MSSFRIKYSMRDQICDVMQLLCFRGVIDVSAPFLYKLFLAFYEIRSLTNLAEIILYKFFIRLMLFISGFRFYHFFCRLHLAIFPITHSFKHSD